MFLPSLYGHFLVHEGHKMFHESYQKIDESFESLGLTPQAARELQSAEWIVTEKLHGANFCILCDGEHLECAKRKALISPEEHFFGYRAVVAPMRGEVLALWRALAAKIERLSRVLIYGELVGGAYPHPDVAPVEDVEPVQTGVYYAPQILFVGFDIAVVSGDERAPIYLDFDLAREVAEEAGIRWSEPLARGTLGDALEFNLAFDSRLPARLGLPALKENQAEGVVVRPAREFLIETEQKGRIRPLLKRKIATFAEDERYHQARNWSAARDKPSGNWGMDRIEWEAFARLTPPRIQAAISKVGRPKDAEDALAEEVLDEVARDVFEELEVTFGEALLAVDAEGFQLLRGILREEARGML